jgi:hypothetical protein
MAGRGEGGSALKRQMATAQEEKRIKHVLRLLLLDLRMVMMILVLVMVVGVMMRRMRTTPRMIYWT